MKKDTGTCHGGDPESLRFGQIGWAPLWAARRVGGRDEVGDAYSSLSAVASVVGAKVRDCNVPTATYWEQQLI